MKENENCFHAITFILQTTSFEQIHSSLSSLPHSRNETDYTRTGVPK